MIPKSFSATSLQVAELCLARYKAEYIDYGRNFQGTAANVGIVCHGTFEEFVRGVFMLKNISWDEDTFWKIFHRQFDEVFGPDRSIPEYTDARNLCYDWFHRDGQEAKLTGVKILSLESKNKFMHKTSAGEIPVNYIMDRLDKTGPTQYRVVDYKSNRNALTPGQLRKKLQARLYALAVQITYKDATEIWVEFDFLRHGPVGVNFTRDDNVATFRMLQRAIKRIINTPDTRIPETLNSECGWCVRKASCKTLQNHINAGGILGKSLEDMAVMHKKLVDQRSAQEELISEIEKQLLTHAAQNDMLEYETESAVVRVTASKRRKPNHSAIATILGDDLAKELGTFTVGAIDKIIKDGRVNAGQAMLLKAAMPLTIGDPTVKIEMKEPF